MDNSTTISMDDIEEYRKELQPHAGAIQMYRRYADGDHVSTITAKQQEAFAPGKHLPIENLVGIILNSLAGRLRFEQWRVDNGPVQRFLDELAMKNTLAKLQYRTHHATARDGMHTITASWNPAADRVMLTREPWWDGRGGMFVAFDDYDQPSWAVKEWVEKEPGEGTKLIEVQRRVVYYPDRFERFRKIGNEWTPYVLPEDTDLLVPNTQSIDWTDDAGQPIGLPVISFAAGSANDTPYGMSEVPDLLGLQDGLNNLHHDIDAAAALTAYQIYWASGVMPDMNPTAPGSDDGLAVAPGSMWEFESPESRAGAVPAGDMSQLLNTTDKKRQAMMIASETPVNQFTGQWPSGQALLRSEMQAIMKCQRYIDQLQPSWTLLAHRSTEIHNVFADGPQLDETAPITSEFANPERLDRLTRIQIEQAQVDLYAAISRISDDVLIDKLDFLTEEEKVKLLEDRKARAEQEATIGQFF